MAIESKTVHHVATLARLKMTPAEAETHTGQLSRILDLMEQLNQLDTETVTPMSHAVEIPIPLRPDKVVNTNQRTRLMACAPDPVDGHFRVPKIIE
jgi:aspartyl-tRNA(Asn)/glutamyl-tRNA(Gln) amidotransferase subunit C